MFDHTLQAHWNRVFENTPANRLGWFEEKPTTSLKLIERCGLEREASILIVGAGTTTLVDALIAKAYEHLIVNDISASALEVLKKRLGPMKDKVSWIVEDLCNPEKLHGLPPLDLWHDRAVLHFLMEQHEQEIYFSLIKKSIKINGFVIIAVFNLNGAKTCSGLPVFRYDPPMLEERLGEGFLLLEAFDHTHMMPSGETREYVYTLFKRKL